MKRLAILGSTGSIGRQCLEVVESMPGRFEVVGLSAGENVALMSEQIRRHRPRCVAVASDRAANALREGLLGNGSGTLPEILCGGEGITAVATLPEVDLVVSSTVGVAALPATYEAVLRGKKLALANKEVLVAAGKLVTKAAVRAGAEILPIDSEHNAIHQCLRAGQSSEVRRLVLTASGGPFRKASLSQLQHATPEQALNHPNWRMGQRITIDSATLMNKGLEIIEAHWLFGFSPDQIEVVIHPQSKIHSMVEFVDGSVVAQLGPADMRLPIQYALTYPERVPTAALPIDWVKVRKLEFSRPSNRKFRCLGLARKALAAGGILPAAMNAADEVAVRAFLERRISFLAIAEVIERVLARIPNSEPGSVDDVLVADREARRLASEEVARCQA
ncbi:MAG TPA: 1-deoxy-D-xylulose-5-phosphate reductoisomerase [Candidatus Acidoferrales bacterium]